VKRILRKGIWIVGILGILFIISYLFVTGLSTYREMKRLRIDSIWRLPSKIYSRELVLTTGMDIERIGLLDRLGRLRYREAPEAGAAGEFSRDSRGMTIFIHPFTLMGKHYDAVPVRLSLDGRQIARIVRIDRNESLQSVTLEPECIMEIFDSLYEDRTIVALEECPKHLLDAIITTEDRRFYDHWGVDFRSLLRAGITNIIHGGIEEGGSTITQQLVKNLFLTNERTMSRKIREMWMSLIMEFTYTKEEILHMYINEVYMGSYWHSGICGLGKASRMFFDKGVSEIGLPEAALLAGMIKAPNAYSPYTAPAKALARRNTVLKLMADEGIIAADLFEQARKEPLSVIPLAPKKRHAPYFVDHVLTLIRDRYPQTFLEKGGYQIHTTLDMHMQTTAESLLEHGLANKDEKIEGAVVIMEPGSGDILAMVGGKKYAKSQFNRAVKIQRHIGSLVKPVIYYTALRRGYTLSSFVDDMPVTVRLEDGSDWSPGNFDKTSHGRILLKDALVNSYNLATVRIGMELGLENIVAEIGRIAPTSLNEANPSVLLGALSYSPLEVSIIYSAFANGGNQVTARAVRGICNENGTLVEEMPQRQPEKILDPAAVYLVDTVLQEVLTSGTARDSRLYGMPEGVCGKTGTSDDLRDSWFVGFTPGVIVTTWLGSDEYLPIGHTGSSGAMPIASMILSRLSPAVTWPVPRDIVICSVDPSNGKLASFWSGKGVYIPYIRGTEPREISEDDTPWVWSVLKSIWKKNEP
jgi:penicillin-binding protein 1B